MKKLSLKDKLQLYTFERIVTIENLLTCFNRCIRGTSWKYSVQASTQFRLSNIYDIFQDLCNGIATVRFGKEFIYNERGKERNIRSVHIVERTVQKLLCDYLLIPVLSPYLIYDNGASLKGKGIGFARKRIKKHLTDFYRKYKTNKGYILCLDFQKYFENINHKIVYDLLKEKILDDKLFNLIWQYIESFGENGLCLGSQISQILAVYYPNKLDHFVKEQLKVKGYGRYMDDSYLLFATKEEAQKSLVKIKEFIKDKGLILHSQKTIIKKLNNGFVFLKGRYLISNTGKIIVRIAKKNIKRQKIKLKKIKKLAIKRKLSYTNLINQVYSFSGHTKGFKCYNSCKPINIKFKKTLEAII